MKPLLKLNTVEPPAQNEVDPLMVGVGFGFTVVVAEVEPEHPFELVTVPVHVPAVVTLML